MKNTFIIIVLVFTFYKLSAQTVLNEGFESGSYNPMISYVSVGSFTSNPGIISNSDLGSTQVFSFGKSTCSSSCFGNFTTTLIITFPVPTYVENISWKEMEIGNNFGSQGHLLLDDVTFATNALGALPVNSGTGDVLPRLQSFSINQTVTTIKLFVEDITNASEIILDDLQINYTLDSKIIGYEYWFNNDYTNKIVTSVSPTQQLTINQVIASNELPSGLNIFNFRSFDNSGRFSSVLSHFFYKQNLPPTQIVAYQYWIDNDFANAITINTPNQLQINIDELLSMDTICSGMHNFNIRFKDNKNLWSSVSSSFFYKQPTQIVAQQNLITEYRYWFDADFENAIYVSIPANQQVNVIDNLNLTRLPKGMYEINLQFKDTTGLWSLLISDSIQKLPLPIADFTFSEVSTCDSTTIIFADNSIDGDTYLWDFGDGNTSDSINPIHTYYSSNIFQVSLTVTDTIAGTDSTIVIPVDASLLQTTSTISETACYSYTAPDGQVYTSSGVKTAIISNAAGCDSIITINLTINTVDVSVTQNEVLLTANATGAEYQWLDCNNEYSIINGETNQSFTATQNGSYAVQINQNDCIDTSACYSVTGLGILENTFCHNIIVYPNPTDGIVKIDLGETVSEFTARITDLNGRLLKQYDYKNKQIFELDLNVLPGIYLLKLQTANGIIGEYKIVKSE